MKVLIVDDDEIKIEKIRTVITEVLASVEFEILIGKTIADAMTLLISQPVIELLILDLNIPVREGSEVKKLAGLTLLNEIARRSAICKPESIVGLTAYKPEELKSKRPFKDEGWSLIHFDIRTNEWENTIRNKLNYLVDKKKMANDNKFVKETILFVASSPIDQAILNAGMEQRKIEEMLEASTFRNKYRFVSKTGAKLSTLTGEMMKLNPQYVHFTGHGDIDGLAMEDDNGKSFFVPSAALNHLFSIFKGIVKCVVLSACYSSEQAKSISEDGIYVIGMNNSVGVDAATEFSKGFYQAIGERREIHTAFKMGLVHLTSSDINQSSIPEIWFGGQKII